MPGVGSIDALDAGGSLKARYRTGGSKMPFTEKQRRAAQIAEHIKERGGQSTAFKDMSVGELKKYAHEPLESAKDQGKALRKKR